VGGHEFIDDGETGARSSGCTSAEFVEPVETLEDRLPALERDSGPVVVDTQIAPPSPECERHHHAPLSVAAGVVQQVGHHPTQRVCVTGGTNRLDTGFERDVGEASTRSDEFTGNDFVEVDVLAADRSRLTAGEDEQIVDEPGGTVEFGDAGVARPDPCPTRNGGRSRRLKVRADR